MHFLVHVHSAAYVFFAFFTLIISETNAITCMNWVLKWKTGRESISGLFPVFIVKRKVFFRRKEKDRVLGSGARVYRLSGDSATTPSSSGTHSQNLYTGDISIYIYIMRGYARQR